MKGETQKDGNFLFLPFFLSFKSIISERMKVPLIFFPVTKTRSVGITEEKDTDTPGWSCRFIGP